MNSSFRIKLPLLIFTICILSTCKREKEPTLDYPLVNTLDVVNITEQGATFRADLSSAGNETIINHGFVWGISPDNLSLESNDRISLGVYSGKGIFETEIKTTLEAKKKYYVRSFVKTQNHIVYGIVVSFVSLGSDAPIIYGFEPKVAQWGDTIVINGKNFSWLSTSNVVYFGSTKATQFAENKKSTDSTLVVLVPNEIIQDKCILSIDLAGNRNYFKPDTLNLFFPRIIDFYPKTATWNDTITLVGNFLKSSYNYNVLFNQTSCKLVSLSEEQCKIIVPNNLQTYSSNISFSIFSYKFSTQTNFNLLPPIIKSINPKIGYCGNLITLKGQYLKKGSTNIKIGGKYASINSNPNDSTIIISVPLLTIEGSCSTSAIVFGKESEPNNEFYYTIPTISKIEPMMAGYNDTVNIYGNYFISNNLSNKVIFNGVSGDYCQAKVVYSSTNLLKVVVPNSLYSEKFSIFIENSIGASAFYYLNFIKPEVSSFSPTQGKQGDTITILGSYLDFYNPIVIFESMVGGGGSATIISKSKNKVVFRIDKIFGGPTGLYFYYGKYLQLTKDFTGISSYKPYYGISMNSIYGENKYQSCLLINDKVYFTSVRTMFLSSMLQDIYQFDPPSNTTQLKVPFGYLHQGSSSFVIDNKGYILSSYSKIPSDTINGSFVEYDPIINKLISKKQFPGEVRQGAFSFSIGGKGYVGCGQDYSGNSLYDFWEYDKVSNSWTARANFPGSSCVSSAFFLINDKGYVINKKEVWEWNPSTNLWTRKNDFPGPIRYHAFSFSIGSKGYLAQGKISMGFITMVEETEILSDMWQYDPTIDSWIKKSSFPGTPYCGGICFVLNAKAYLGGLNLRSNLYEYDPELDN
jgi:hypothetical protein